MPVTGAVRSEGEEPRGRRTGAALLLVLLGLVILSLSGTFGYLWFARTPVQVAGYAIAGPNCEPFDTIVVWGAAASSRAPALRSSNAMVSFRPAWGNRGSAGADLDADGRMDIVLSSGSRTFQVGPFTVYESWGR